MFAVEYLPGQYDQTADSAAQCVQLVTQKERPQIATARVIVLTGTVDDKALQEIKDYCINASRAARRRSKSRSRSTWSRKSRPMSRC